MSKLYIIHENYQWFEPIEKVLMERNISYESCYMESGSLNISDIPKEGVYFNKMSASSYTRDHRFAPDYTSVLLSYLEAHGLRVINGSKVLKLEMSKIDQYICLQQAGIRVPKTTACFGKENIIETAKSFSLPFIMKPNRGGKGSGVQLFTSYKMLEEYLAGGQYETPIDDIMLIQEYIEAPEPFITRLEFIGGKFVYAVRVDTSEGFELCPAEACRIDAPAKASEFCALNAGEGLFSIIEKFDDPIVGKIEKFLRKNSIEVAGVEFIRDRNGAAYVYDINTNTNYNPQAEAKAGISAICILADFLEKELRANGHVVTMPIRRSASI